MINRLAKKIKHPGLIVLLFAVILLIIGILSFHRWSSTQYFGEITGISSGGFVIKTGAEGDKLIKTNQATIIRKGRGFIDEKLAVGDFVIVVGSLIPDGSLEARVIRVVKPPPGPPL
jgi:hypothetical protein